MNKQYYNDCIEKCASIDLSTVGNKALQLASKHKKGLVGAGVGAGTLGAVYGLSGDETRQKMKNIGESIVTGKLNGGAQSLVSNAGAIAGTALSMKHGKSLGQAIGSGGLAGMALGDIAGSIAIPTSQLYKKHKEEFGEAPDAKSVGTVLAANLGPTAALWGGLYGLKKGKKIRSQIGESLAGGVSNIQKGIGELANPKINKGVSSRGFSSAEDIRNGVKITDKSKGAFSNPAFKGMWQLAGAAAPIELAATVAELPTYLATPKNIVEAKKKRLAEQNLESTEG